MSTWYIADNEVRVIAEKPNSRGERILFEPGKDRPNLWTMGLDGGLGMAVFSTREWAEKFCQDSNLQGMEPVKMDSFLTWIRELKTRFPRLTCVILDPIGGYKNVRTTPIDDLLKGNPG